MPVARPIPCKAFKKMILVVLNEHHCPGGKYQGHSWDINGIATTKICEHFNLGRLSPEEQVEARLAVSQLERDGFIVHDPNQSNSVFKVLTDKGRTAIKSHLEDMNLDSVDIDSLITDEELRSRVHDDYVSGDYDTCVFRAYKLLEERVRSMGGLPATAIGADLMSQALKPQSGILENPEAQTPGEAEGIHHLFRGAIMWFKNPESHRTVGYDNSLQVAQALVLADLLLQLLSQCRHRT